jgi:hypothetical protein
VNVTENGSEGAPEAPKLISRPAPAANLVIRGARFFDPRTGLDGTHDLVVRDGEIAEIAESELKVTPPRLSTRSGGELPSKIDPHTNVESPQCTSYQARVPIDDPEGLVRLGIRGQARVYTDWLPLGTRLWRLVAQTFNFKM